MEGRPRQTEAGRQAGQAGSETRGPWAERQTSDGGCAGARAESDGMGWVGMRDGCGCEWTKSRRGSRAVKECACSAAAARAAQRSVGEGGNGKFLALGKRLLRPMMARLQRGILDFWETDRLDDGGGERRRRRRRRTGCALGSLKSRAVRQSRGSRGVPALANQTGRCAGEPRCRQSSMRAMQE